MAYQIIVLPRAAHPLVVGAIQAKGISVTLAEKPKTKLRKLGPEDRVYVCQQGNATIEIVVWSADNLPENLSHLISVLILRDLGFGFFRWFRRNTESQRLQEQICIALEELKDQVRYDAASS
jgi:hypothetical protein